MLGQFSRKLVTVFPLIALALSYVTGQRGMSLPCIAYGGPCSNGSQNCCFNPMAICLMSNREQLACLSPLDLTNLSPSITSSPLYTLITESLANTTRSFLNLFPGMSSLVSSAMNSSSG